MRENFTFEVAIMAPLTVVKVMKWQLPLQSPVLTATFFFTVVRSVSPVCSMLKE
jgi:hypothetical protein